jgi:electron-transferring-flavoprotein dehydrogenase
LAICAAGWGQAEELGVEIFPGFPAAELLYEGDRLIGVQTGDMGVSAMASREPTISRA